VNPLLKSGMLVYHSCIKLGGDENWISLFLVAGARLLARVCTILVLKVSTVWLAGYLRASSHCPPFVSMLPLRVHPIRSTHCSWQLLVDHTWLAICEKAHSIVNAFQRSQCGGMLSTI
jgi:hypothetical protein